MNKYSFGDFSVVYDSLGDVMYVSRLRLPAYTSVEKGTGFLFRYSKDNELIGVTIIDFRDMSQDDLHWLSLQLGTSLDDMNVAIYNEIKRVTGLCETINTGQSSI